MQPLWAVALQALQQDAAGVDRIAANMANVATTGYRREILVQRPIGEVGGTFSGTLARVAASASASLEVVRDPRPGTSRATGQALDLALAGAGFFEVMTPAGPAYTRQGHFAVDARGVLVTAVGGHPVMGHGGEIVVAGTAFKVDQAGRVTQEGGHQVGQLRIVDGAVADLMSPAGSGFYTASRALAPVADGQVNVRQGFIENANVDPAQEMVRLSRTLRHFESMHRLAQGYDEMLSLAIRRLGEP